MARQIIPMKRNDLLPDLRVRLCDTNNPTGVDLTLATEVRVLAYGHGAVKIDQEMTVADQEDPALLGVVSYQWQAEDTDTIGDYDLEFQVMWPGDRPQTWPVAESVAASYLVLRVLKDLGPVVVAP
jgi:hypothetical protein